MPQEFFKSRGVEVYSVSTDTHFPHKAWHLLPDKIGTIATRGGGDQTGTTAKQLNVMREGQGPADRATFRTDPRSVIR